MLFRQQESTKTVTKIGGGRWFYVVMIIALGLLAVEIVKLAQTIRNKNCIANVYHDKVIDAVIRPTTEREMIAKALFPPQVMATRKLDDKANLCAMTFSYDENVIEVRYRPRNAKRTLSAGRMYSVEVFYGVEILHIDVN